MPFSRHIKCLTGLCLGLVLSACSLSASEPTAPTLRLATTTSTYDSGLLAHILPDFERAHAVSVDVIAVGTGQALSLGELGDVDVLLVHAPESERNFIEAGHGLARVPIMYNDFVLVGPQHDPAGISSFDQASSALAHLVAADAAFASRGDNSGTHKKEQFLWGLAGLDPTDGWEGYFSLGQGMGETLRFAEEKSSYALTDRGTFLALADRLPHIAVLLGGDSIEVNPDPELLNTYSAIAVDPGKSDQIKHELALTFIEWLVSPTVKDQISAFGIEQFGQPLFFPAIGPPDA